MSLKDLMQRAKVWRAGELSPLPAQSTGFAVLDEVLPGGGWPQTGLTEILSSTPGSGSLRLVLPTLIKLSQSSRWVIWIGPPHIPFSPALVASGFDLSRLLIVELPETQDPKQADGLWAFEQALRFHDCAAALMWLDDIELLSLRRLQLAAESGASWGIIFRPTRFAATPSPARLRLKLEPVPDEAEHSASENISALNHRKTNPTDKPQQNSPSMLDVTIIKAPGARVGSRHRVAL